MVDIAGEKLNDWEAESAYNFLQVWEKMEKMAEQQKSDQNPYKDLVAVLNNPQDISTTLKARKHFEKLLPESHERLTGFFQTMDTDKEKVTRVLKKLLKAREQDIALSPKAEMEGQYKYGKVSYTIYDRAKKPLLEWYKEYEKTLKDRVKSDSPTVTQNNSSKQTTYIPSRTASPASSPTSTGSASSRASSSTSTERGEEAKKRAEMARKISEHLKPKGPRGK